jgi:hypothetical protein
MRQRTSLRIFAAGSLLLAAACSDQNEPVAPSSQPESPSLRPTPQATGDDPIALARAVPGFGDSISTVGEPRSCT